MFTNSPTAMVAASLRQVRPIAHEIIVAVDDRVPVDELGPLQAVADRLIRAEFVSPLEANLSWLHSLATGDWVLRLDGDDVVSDQLVRTLGAPGWDTGVTHAYLQYRWVWGDGSTMLDQPPWWPDPALRLIRNVAGIAEFPTGAHEPPKVAGDARFLDVALYHLDLVVQGEADRAAKATAYEHQSPGRRTDRGWSVSTTYYLPERAVPAPRTAPLPAVDAAVVAQVLEAARSVAPPTPATDLDALEPAVSAADRRPPLPAPGDARLRVIDHDPVTVLANRSAVITVGVTNNSTTPWSPHTAHPHRIGGRFFDADGTQVGAEVRAPLPGSLEPGSEGLVRVGIPPHVPGEAVRFEVGLVQDGVDWHDARASVGLRRLPSRRVLVSTGISRFEHLGDDLITQQVLAALARHLPDVVPVLLAHPVVGLDERFGCEVAVGPAALSSGSSRGSDGNRRARDLVNQARLMARGTVPDDPGIEQILQPFADASALVIAPGGGLASRYSADALMVCAVQALIARAFDLPVFLEGPSIGPIEVRRDHAALGQLLNDATRITLRDQPSADAARRIGRAIAPTVVPDPATAAVEHLGRAPEEVAAWLASVNVPRDRAYAVFSCRPTERDVAALGTTFRAAAEALPEHTALIFLPHCTGDRLHDDLAVLRQDEWAGRFLVPWDPALGQRAATALVAGAAMAIGSRFHHSVLAAAAGVRALGLVADEYDRLRIRGLKRAGAVRVVDLDDPAGAAEAVAALRAGPDPHPIERWDGEAFAAALGAVLPAPPPLA